jgi:hypothetical protein
VPLLEKVWMFGFGANAAIACDVRCGVISVAVSVPASAWACVATDAFVAVTAAFAIIVVETVPVSPTVTTLLPARLSVPGTSTLLVHSTPVPAASVCSTWRAVPSASLLTAISAVALMSVLVTVPVTMSCQPVPFHCQVLPLSV